MVAKDFPTGSHKVGPAYSVMAEKFVDGLIEPGRHTLVFPSTGNYGIGGSWVGPRAGFKSMVILPEGMSRERFEDGFQSLPVDWTISSKRKRAFFGLLKEITGS